MNSRLLLKVLPFLPFVLRRKSGWLLIALAAAGYYYFQGGEGFSMPSLAMPDLSIDQLWKEPRDLLVDRVEDARDAQEEAAEEFQSALEKFKAVTGFSGGDLEKQFNVLNSAFERSEDSAGNISKRVDKVVSATNDLLDEWREELNQYHDNTLRQRAERQFDQTRAQAEQLIEAMRRAEKKTEPVLSAFRDQVLYLKHNLNMQAIASLDEEAENISGDVERLVAEMQASIREANEFIEALKENV